MRKTQSLSLFLSLHSGLDSSMSSFIKYYVSSHWMDYNESLENLKMFSTYLFSVISRRLNVLANADQFLLDFTVLAALQ